MTRLAKALAAIDAANANDPTQTDSRPAALIYGERMSVELARMFPGADDILLIAARGQHVERWLLPRADYPAGKAGYLDWRREQVRRHGLRVAAIMHEAGYEAAACDRVQTLLRKEGIKRDDAVQALEDVICFTFLRWYLDDFALSKDPEQVLDILTKTGRKMSADARIRALVEFDLPAHLAACLQP